MIKKSIAKLILPILIASPISLYSCNRNKIMPVSIDCLTNSQPVNNTKHYDSSFAFTSTLLTDTNQADLEQLMMSKDVDDAVILLKNLEVCDPIDGKVKTYNQLVLNELEMLSAYNLSLPPEFAKDPVKAFFLATRDKTYPLMYSKVIKTKQGWISPIEVTNQKTSSVESKLAYSSLKDLKDIKSAIDGIELASTLKEFVGYINKNNKMLDK